MPLTPATPTLPPADATPHTPRTASSEPPGTLLGGTCHGAGAGDGREDRKLRKRKAYAPSRGWSHMDTSKRATLLGNRLYTLATTLHYSLRSITCTLPRLFLHSLTMPA